MIIDVSEHQGKIDWSKASKEVEGVIIRCGHNKYAAYTVDKQFTTNVEACIKYKIPFGVYTYTYSNTDAAAKTEAKDIIKILKPYKDKLSLPVYYDLEQAGTEKTAVSRAKVFAKALETEGYTVGMYSGEWWWNAHLKGLDGYTKWVAKYGSNNGTQQSKPDLKGRDYDIWQYSSKGKVNGIAGNVDINTVLDKSVFKKKTTTVVEKVENKDDKKIKFVKSIQKAVGVEQTGVYDAKTKKALPLIKKGAKGNLVKAMQQGIMDVYGGKLPKYGADGDFGSETATAVKALQKTWKIEVDGEVGKDTWGKLLG